MSAGKHSLSNILLDPSCLPHLCGAEVAVVASTIPVPFHWLGVEGTDHAKIFSYAIHDESCHPQIIGHLDAFTGPDLVFPLATKLILKSFVTLYKATL